MIPKTPRSLAITGTVILGGAFFGNLLFYWQVKEDAFGYELGSAAWPMPTVPRIALRLGVALLLASLIWSVLLRIRTSNNAPKDTATRKFEAGDLLKGGALAALFGTVSFVLSFVLIRRAFIYYWEWQTGHTMKFTFWAEENAFPLAFVIAAAFAYVAFVRFRERKHRYSNSQ